MIAVSDEPTRRRRWPIVVAALTVVVLVGIAATVWWFKAGSSYWARSHWQPPKQAYLSSMRTQPAPGWTTDVTAMGLPVGSTIDTDEADGVPGPIFETRDNRLIMLASSPAQTQKQWWLTGVDATDGHALFRPVPLNTTTQAPSCFLNGLAVVCIADDDFTATAWVIDGNTGRLTFTGPTDVRTVTGKLKAEQAGDYLVAAAEDEGLYGVGPNAQTTWFMPGAVIGMGTYRGSVSTGGPTAMFSLKDGQRVPTEFPAGAKYANSAFFDDGFVGKFDLPDGTWFFQFFDSTGKPTSDERIRGLFIGGTAGNLAVIVQANGYAVYGPTGDKLLDVQGDRPQGMQLIGSTLWVGESGNGGQTQYQSYDLRTGDKAQACGFDLTDDYLGTDGSVFVRAPRNHGSDDVAKAYDLTTCDLLWSIPRHDGPFGEVTRVGDTLVRLSDDGTQLSSLVSP